MKTREIVCENYEYEGKCKIGRISEFRGYCQHCPDYKARKGAVPARVDTRRKKLARAERKDMDKQFEGEKRNETDV